MDNEQLATAFLELADLLEIHGANPFRVRPYRNAARVVSTHPTPLETLVGNGRKAVEAIPGLGKDLAAKIEQLSRTGRLAALDELRSETPPGLVAMTGIHGLGPKRVGQIWRELGVTTVAGLEKAAQDGSLDGLAGFGPKMREKILAGVAALRSRAGRFKISEADEELAPLLAWLGAARSTSGLVAAGAVRRRCETVERLRILATAEDDSDAASRLASYDGVAEVLDEGPGRVSVTLQSGLPVELHAARPESAGAALWCLTGSDAHKEALLRLAREKDVTIDDRGVFAGSERIGGATEEEVYAALDLPWIPPELREHEGEIEAARRGVLPDLLRQDMIRGDLQMHSTYSDGRDTLEAMIEACRARGYDYMAVTDHSPSMRVANGLTPERFKAQYDEIDELQEAFDDIRVLKSAEVDILADGSLDLEDDVLELMDVVLVSVHSKFNMTKGEMTKRIGAALRHPRVKILGHPTGRLINRREPYPVDVDELLSVASGEGVLLELNANPNRLDLEVEHLRAAKQAGVKVVISTDAHRTAGLGLMSYGVEQARRAWLTAEDVANSQPLPDFLRTIGAS